MLKNPTNHNLFGPHWANEFYTFLQKKNLIKKKNHDKKSL
jgi:hypothetical protein